MCQSLMHCLKRLIIESQVIFSIRPTKEAQIYACDAAVAVALLHLMPLLKLSTLAEVWMKTGREETRRTVPLHKIHTRKPELCKILMAIHNLTGADTTSKVGTNKGGLKSLTELLKDLDKSDDTTKAEEYLCQNT